MSRPSEYELKLLRPLWREGRLSAREIHEASKQATGWSYSATRKTLERMVEKELVRLEPVHGLNTYAPVHSKLETLASLMSAFARDVLDLREPMPAAAFAASTLIEPEEIEELESLLEQLARKGGKEDAS